MKTTPTTAPPTPAAMLVEAAPGATRRRRPGHRVVALALPGLLLLTACGGDGDAETDQAAGGSLAEAFGLPDIDFMSGEQSDSRDRLLQEEIAKCMVAAGFEYTPVDPSEASANFSDDGDRVARAERSGFGISVYYGNIELAREDEPIDGASGTNPNEEYVQSLSEGETEAYYAALYGTEEELAELQEVEVDPESGEESTMTSGVAGCEGKATEAVFQGFSMQSVQVMEQLYTEIQERVDADPRIVKLQQEWRTCMSEAGFDQFEDSTAVGQYFYDDFQKKVNAVVGENTSPLAGLTEEQIANLTPAELDDLQYQRYEIGPDVDRAALTALQDEERTLAVANAKCSEAVYKETAEVFREVEAAYVTENADRIAQAVASTQE